MGEPLHNVDNVIKASSIMVDEQGLQFSPRKVTVSTSGLVPQIKRFLHESNCDLAVSLNATTDEVKSKFDYSIVVKCFGITLLFCILTFPSRSGTG
jgi:adenine C2-methylase RlmN of 23S rRNA A2503 and tRNA A37